jgi:hypothetical protein
VDSRAALLGLEGALANQGGTVAGSRGKVVAGDTRIGIK